VKIKESAVVPIVDTSGVTKAQLHISLLPTTVRSESVHSAPLLELSAEEGHDAASERVQLLEGQEYKYAVELTPPASSLVTDKEEIVYPDDKTGVSGRLRPGLHTGWLSIRFLAGDRLESASEVGRAALEVRSRKLQYREHYQWMLRDIANECTEIVMERFAASEQRFEPSGPTDPATLYQRFAFLRSLIGGKEFAAALQQIVSRPHVRWEEVIEQRPPERGLKPSSGLLRELTAPGPRAPVNRPVFGLTHLPRTIATHQTEVAVDNPPNRFVKFALSSWREIVDRTVEALQQESPSAPVRRGLLEAVALRDELDAVLAEELFREVGDLQQFPANDQVLQKREGYRDVLRGYIQFQIAANLSWKALEDSYKAGQRNVATLYEYWVFIQLAKLVATFCGEQFDLSRVLETGALNIGLKQGSETLVDGTAIRLGRRLRLELTFNKTFPRQSGHEGSWTLPMRPDCSLCIRSESGDETDFVPVWLHFDAKYRIESLKEVFGKEEATGEIAELSIDRDSAEQPQGLAKRDDLLKMHSYRDAIKRSAGAYVLYPGPRESDKRKWREYHELLPGLGAFALRPSDDESGQPDGIESLRSFIDDVLEHVASQPTRHERSRYWINEVNEIAAPPEKHVPWVSFLPRPPADTWVGLTPVSEPAELAWIETHHLVPLPVDRATQDPQFDPRVLTADLLFVYTLDFDLVTLYRVVGEPEVASRSRLREQHHPRAESSFYYCVRVEPIPMDRWANQVTKSSVVAARQARRRHVRRDLPVAVTWWDLVVEV
jgi:predicted component of viral defense system (DUF524 family)